MVFNAQIILISNFIDSVNVARYLVVTKFYEIIGVGIANFTMVLFPSLSNLQAQGNWLKLKQTFLSVLFRVSIMVVVIFAFILTIGQNIFIYWSNYNDSLILNLFQFYSVFVAIIIIEHVPTVFLSALKLNKWPSIIATVQGVLGLLISYILLPKYGITGAIIASLISFVLTNCWFNPYYLIRSLNQKIKI
jgi:O-antigen/teichoic acid export membrane protein